MTSTFRQDDRPVFAETAADHRRRTRRQERHEAHVAAATLDDDVIADRAMKRPLHDVGRKTSPKLADAPKPGRRPGFKVWKTAFWKRRTHLRHEQNEQIRALAEAD